MCTQSCLTLFDPMDCGPPGSSVHGTSQARILQPKKDVLFIIGDWNAKVGSEEIAGVMGKFGLGVQNEEGKG